MRVSVCGGGIFGCTAAIFLAREGHKVTLYEQKDTLLTGASGHNQFRLHAGYHYPRSSLTIRECLDTRASFMAEYGSALLYGGRHIYGIAKNSKVSVTDYRAALDGHDLPYVEATLPDGVIDPSYVPYVFSVPEHWIDIDMLRKIVFSYLHKAGVEVKVNTKAEGAERHNCDRMVVAAYYESNDFTDQIPAYERCKRIDLQFELVEKPVIWMDDERMRNLGIVVMDGNYPCVDPYGPREAHLLSHVHHAIHRRQIGHTFTMPYYIANDVNAGIIENRRVRFSHFEDMRDDGAFYIPPLRKAHHIGSFYTVRAVKPNVDATDERLTDVRYIDKDKGIIRIFSGKIGSCVSAAKQVLELL
jgi:hypothetical protein